MSEAMDYVEYSASEIRKVLQGLFPERRLVLSQFTFFNQVGVARPTGSSFRRGRRCYRLQDLLSIACILALKEEGIPYKNVEEVPALIQANADRIFELGTGCRLSGFGSRVALNLPGSPPDTNALDTFLAPEGGTMLFWGFDVGFLALQLRQVAERLLQPAVAQAA